MSKTYSNLRLVRSDDGSSWSVYATWYDDDEGRDGKPFGNVEWEVPEWTGLESEREALSIIRGYEDGTLAEDLIPWHPHQHT